LVGVLEASLHGSREYMLHYFGRHTHRVAISNYRLVAFVDGHVTLPGAIPLTTTNKSC
jgi:hypothetical protein